jgi:hypothetical protein
MLGNPLGERGDGPVAVAALVTAPRVQYGTSRGTLADAGGPGRGVPSGRGLPSRAARWERLEAEMRRLSG